MQIEIDKSENIAIIYYKLNYIGNRRRYKSGIWFIIESPKGYFNDEVKDNRLDLIINWKKHSWGNREKYLQESNDKKMVLKNKN